MTEFNLALRRFLMRGFPLWLGRTFFRSRKDLKELLNFLVIAGLVQSLFLLVEIRLSPQWHTWVYGYGAHSDFLQTMRWGGYRPMNFMAHGLALALFMMVALLSAIILKKTGASRFRRFKSKHVIWYLVVVLVLCKSTGAIFYSLLLIPLLFRAKPSTQMRVAAILAFLVAAYPMLRAAELVPVEELGQWAEGISEERAQSLMFRFDNEEILLEKARKRLWFGWGGKGRRSIYDEEMGKQISVSDGHWVIVLGMRGLIGFLVSFGLLLFPVYWTRRHFKRWRDPMDQRLIAGVAILVAIVSFDLVPNGLFSNYPYLLAGALMGAVQEVVRRPATWASTSPRFTSRRTTLPEVRT